MASIGPSYFTTTVQQTTAYTGTWSNPDNSRVDDGSFASITVANTTNTNELRFNLADIGLPNNGIITGIAVDFRCRSTSTSVEMYVSITDGTNASPNYYGFNRWLQFTAANTWQNFFTGSTTDIRGLNAAQLTTNWWNSGASYVTVYPYNFSGSTQTVDVDWVAITVYYDESKFGVGYNSVATGANNTSVGNTNWTGVTNIYTSNNTRASVALPASPNAGSSRYLVARNCGFSIPSNATITGVHVKVENYVSSAIVSPAFSAKLWNGTSTTADNSIGAAYTWTPDTGESTWWFGGASDTWSASLTPAIVNSASFGVAIQATKNSPLSATFYVDWVSIQVYYTLPPPAAANCSVQSSLIMLGVGI